MIDDGKKNDQNQTDKNPGTMDEGSLGGQASRENQLPNSNPEVDTDTESSDIE